MTLRNALGALGLDATLQAIRDRLPVPTGAGRLPVDIAGANITGTFNNTPSVASVGNTPPGPLGANETFVGMWEDVLDYSAIQVGIFTDVASATNGAVVEFSADGANVLRSVPTTIPANFGAYFALAPQARFVRFRYVNGPAAQTVLRLSVLYSFNTPAEVSQPLASTITDANIASVVRAVLAGREAATGKYLPVQTTASGRLLVDVGATQALTDAQLRASRVPVDVEIDQPLTDAQLRATQIATMEFDEFYSSALGGRRAFNASTGLVSAAALSATVAAVFHNPTDSGVDCLLSKLSISQGAAGTWERTRMPTFTGGTLQPAVNRGGGALEAKGRLLTGATITAAGTPAKHHHGQANTESIDRILLGIVLRPGQSVLWRFTNPSPTAATTVALEPVWVERPAAA